MMVKSKRKTITSTILLSAICFLLVDFFFTHEFKIEGSYIVGVILLLIMALLTQFIRTYRWLLIGICSLIIGVCVYQFYILLLFGWGYSFTGSEFPIIWMVALILNILLSIVAFEGGFDAIKVP